MQIWESHTKLQLVCQLQLFRVVQWRCVYASESIQVCLLHVYREALKYSAAMAPYPTNYTEIQQDEIEALRSIYMDDFVEEGAKIGAWNKSLDRTFKIKLRPASDDDGRGLTLSVSFPPAYPKSLPRLSLDFGSEIHKKAKKEAQDILKTKPKSLIGSEMMYEIVSSLQDALDNTGIKPTDLPTLDEERAAHEEATRLLAEKAEEERRQQELKAREEEERSLQALVKQRAVRHDTREMKSTNPSNNVSMEDDQPGVLVFDQASRAIKLPNMGGSTIINAIHKRVKYRTGPVCETFTVQPIHEYDRHNAHSYTDVGSDETPEETPFLLLKEFHIMPSKCDETVFKRAIQNLESKLELYTGLKPHQSVLTPLNFKIQRSRAKESNGNTGWTVSVLFELAERHSLKEALAVIEKLDIKQIRAWSIGLIEGLQHYHRHGSAHGSLHVSNILLVDGETEKGNRKVTIAKLSDGGFQHNLHLLKNGTTFQASPMAWTAPEVVNNLAQADVIPATDIWNFGLCFLQMAFGLGVLHEYQSPTTFLEELALSRSLRAMLSQVFNNDSKRRPSAWDLLHFEFFRNDDTLLEAAGSLEELVVGGSVPKLIESQRLYPRRDSHTGPSSRYDKDFVEEGRLGRGGFAEVFRARNKVDGQLYAIKKIKANSRSALDPVLSEATVLSRLNHPNVVRYFASWIDDSLIRVGDEEDFSDTADSSSLAYAGHRALSNLPMSSRGLDFISSTRVNVVFGKDYEENDTESSNDDDANESVIIDDDSDSYDQGISSQRPSEAHPRSHEPKTSTVLYIQMEYCKQEVRNVPQPVNVLELLGNPMLGRGII